MRPAVRALLPLLALAFFSPACAGPSEIDRIPPGTPGYLMLPGRITLPQGSHSPTNCGPEALCGALNFLGIPVTIAEVEREIYNTRIQGSVAPQIVEYARRKGASPKLSVRGGGWPKLVEHIKAGSPVMIEVTRGGQYHYYLIAGVGTADRVVVCAHYGDRQLILPADLLDELWKPRYYSAITFTIPPAEELALQAQECLEAGRYELAEKLALQALAKESKQGLALAVLGRVRIQQKRFSEARDLLERALESMPGDDSVLNDLAHVILELKGDARRAEKLAGEAVSIKLRHIRDLEDERRLALPGTEVRIVEDIATARFRIFYYYGTWGQALEAAGQPKRSVEERERSFAHADEIDPDHLATRHLETALALKSMGDKARAEEHFNKALSIAKAPDLKKRIESEAKGR